MTPPPAPAAAAPSRPVEPGAGAAARRDNRLLWLMVAAALLTFAGYVAPWAPHKAAGLVIPGLDLAEYVKFLPALAGGALDLWREGFYLPLLAVSLTLSLLAFRLPLPAGVWGWLLRLLAVVGAMAVALNLLPPAWTPPLLRTPEFRLQSGVMLLLLAFALASPLLALLPRRLVAGLILLASLPAIWIPVAQYLRIRPQIEELYRSPLPLGWGLYATVAGLALMAAAALIWALRPTRPPFETATSRRKGAKAQ